jgi:threonine aldolase
MIVDLRSDTLTKPTAKMLAAMMQAKVGDDVFEEDPTVIELEQRLADMFGMEAGLFCPSGTMSNQIAIRILTRPQDQIICDKNSHIYLYEGGGCASNSMVSVRTVEGQRGRLNETQVAENINPDDIHFPHSRLLSLENTVNKAGGSCYTLEDIEPLAKLCRKHKLKMHLDGARIFNALERTKDDSKGYGEYFDTISICLSKGLGAPVGSVLLTSNELMKNAKRVRKVMGGGMRQIGYLAAAGIYAIENNIVRLKQDHKRARQLGKVIRNLPFVEKVLPIDTNIVLFSLKKKHEVDRFLSHLEDYQIKAVSMGGQTIRFVTHLDIDSEMIKRTINVLQAIRL